jgi:hypothetical protein
MTLAARGVAAGACSCELLAGSAQCAPMKNAVLVTSCALLAAGCGLLTKPFGTRDAKCDLRPHRAQCTDLRDFPGPSLVTFQGVCETLKAVTPDGGVIYAEGERCDSAASLGGCQSTSLDGTQQTNWYYQSTKYPTAAEAQAECDSNAPFV